MREQDVKLYAYVISKEDEYFLQDFFVTIWHDGKIYRCIYDKMDFEDLLDMIDNPISH